MSELKSFMSCVFICASVLAIMQLVVLDFPFIKGFIYFVSACVLMYFGHRLSDLCD